MSATHARFALARGKAIPLAAPILTGVGVSRCHTRRPIKGHRRSGLLGLFTTLQLAVSSGVRPRRHAPLAGHCPALSTSIHPVILHVAQVSPVMSAQAYLLAMVAGAARFERPGCAIAFPQMDIRQAVRED